MTDDQGIVIVAPDGSEHEFPAGMDPKRAAAIVRAQFPEGNRTLSDAQNTGGAAMAGVPAAANIAARVATSPTLPQTAATIGRVTGAIAPMVAGGYEYGLPGFMSGAVGAAKGSWAGGKTGYFTGKLIQKAALPVAKGLEAIAPAASALSGASGVGDLAQMAEPNRKDIGFLGLGPSVNVPGAEPPLINGLLARLRAYYGSK